MVALSLSPDWSTGLRPLYGLISFYQEIDRRLQNLRARWSRSPPDPSERETPNPRKDICLALGATLKVTCKARRYEMMCSWDGWQMEHEMKASEMVFRKGWRRLDAMSVMWWVENVRSELVEGAIWRTSYEEWIWLNSSSPMLGRIWLEKTATSCLPFTLLFALLLSPKRSNSLGWASTTVGNVLL